MLIGWKTVSSASRQGNDSPSHWACTGSGVSSGCGVDYDAGVQWRTLRAGCRVPLHPLTVAPFEFRCLLSCLLSTQSRVWTLGCSKSPLARETRLSRVLKSSSSCVVPRCVYTVALWFTSPHGQSAVSTQQLRQGGGESIFVIKWFCFTKTSAAVFRRYSVCLYFLSPSLKLVIGIVTNLLIWLIRLIYISFLKCFFFTMCFWQTG